MKNKRPNLLGTWPIWQIDQAQPNSPSSFNLLFTRGIVDAAGVSRSRIATRHPSIAPPARLSRPRTPLANPSALTSLSSSLALPPPPSPWDAFPCAPRPPYALGPCHPLRCAPMLRPRQGTRAEAHSLAGSTSSSTLHPPATSIGFIVTEPPDVYYTTFFL